MARTVSAQCVGIEFNALNSANTPLRRSPYLHALRVSPVRLDVRSLAKSDSKRDSKWDSKPHPLIQKTDSSIFPIFVCFYQSFPKFFNNTRRLLGGFASAVCATAWTPCVPTVLDVRKSSRRRILLDGYLNFVNLVNFKNLNNKNWRFKKATRKLPPISTANSGKQRQTATNKRPARTGPKVTIWNHITHKVNLRFCFWPSEKDLLSYSTKIVPQICEPGYRTGLVPRPK